MENQCKHLTEAQRNELLTLLQKCQGFFMVHLSPGKQVQ